MRTLFAFILLASFFNVANASVITTQLSAACMALDNGTSKKCDCMSNKFTTKLSQKENTYALALLTLNEKLLTPINGSFDDQHAEAVKAKIIPLMMECLL